VLHLKNAPRIVLCLQLAWGNWTTHRIPFWSDR
jgi:hypothetical protein